MIAPESSRTGEIGQRDVEPPAILRHADRLEVLDAFAPPQPRQDVVFLRLPLGRNQHADRPSDQLVGRIAEHALRRGVARLDDAVEVLRDDGVVGRVDDRGEVRFGRTCLAPHTRQLELRGDDASSSRALNGLTRYSSAPACRPSMRASSPARAESRITGSERVRSSARIAASRPNPSSVGIITSASTRSGELLRIRSSAAPPSPTVSTR